MIKVITVPEKVRDQTQRANIERDSRRDILIYIMEHENELNLSEERKLRYQKEYDDKYFAFEQAKTMIEKEYVLPAVNNVPNTWSLDYSTCEITIELNENS